MAKQNWTAAAQKTQTERLNRVIDDIKRLTAKQQSSLVIFDLDGTLFDNRTRTIFILREISELFSARVPQLAAAFDRYHELSVIDYSVETTLRRMKVSNKKEIEFIKQEWGKRFFSDDYQKFDFPLLGAKSYVCRAHAAGATVIYLTGRDVGRMLVGTTECLRLYGFPVGIEGTMMIVKKRFEQDDELFKKEVSTYLARLGKVVAVYENEPANSNILQAKFPDAASFFVLTQHRPDAPRLSRGIYKIRDFRVV